MDGTTRAATVVMQSASLARSLRHPSLALLLVATVLGACSTTQLRAETDAGAHPPAVEPVRDGGGGTSDAGVEAAAPQSDEERCTASGGTVVTRACCAESSDFPDSCSVGACSCDPSKSPSRKACQCPSNTCWSATERSCLDSKMGPAPFNAMKCRSFCASPGALTCGRVAGSVMQAGSGTASADGSGCLVNATIESFSAQLRFDCVKGEVCLQANDGSETCQPAAGGGGQMLYTTPSESVLCLP